MGCHPCAVSLSQAPGWKQRWTLNPPPHPLPGYRHHFHHKRVWIQRFRPGPELTSSSPFRRETSAASGPVLGCGRGRCPVTLLSLSSAMSCPWRTHLGPGEREEEADQVTPTWLVAPCPRDRWLELILIAEAWLPETTYGASNALVPVFVLSGCRWLQSPTDQAA